MKKIALLFYGELRTFDNEIVIKSWNKFKEKYDITVYVCCWNHRGRSIFSVEQNLNDNINQKEHMSEEYVKKIFNTNNVKLFDYDEWFNNEYTQTFIKKYGFYEKYFNPLFAGGFLRYKLMDYFKNNNIYDCLILSRPDNILLQEPPEYFFDGNDTVWHQRNGLNNIIYSTFISSSQENILNLCNWYVSELVDESINSNDSRYNNKLEHCGVLYSYLKMQNIKDDTYIGTLFAEPYRYHNDIQSIKEFTKLKELWFLE